MRKLLIFIFAIGSQFSVISQPINILPNTFYSNGEIITYVLKYGFIVGGQATIEIKDSCLDLKNLFQLKAIAKTTGIADKLFHVRDVYESFITKDSGFPEIAIQNVKEGRTYKYYNEARYYRKNNLIVSSKSGEHRVKDSILDILSAFYFVRRIDFSKLKEGDAIKLVTFFSDEEFPLELRYRGKETISTKWGKIRCIKIAPVVEPGRVFKSKDDMLLWYSDDANRILIKVIFELKVGHLTVELRNYAKLRNNIEFIK
jgi:hypothetical protein